MQFIPSHHITHSLLEQILTSIDQHIEMSELQLLLPVFLFSDLGFIIRQQPQQQHMSWPIVTATLTEEMLEDVPRLMKDSLMPKDPNQEKRVINLSNLVPKLSKMPSKRNVSVLSKRTAASLGEKLQSITSRQSRNERNASSISKCSPLVAEQNEEEESYEMFKMRERTQARMQYLQEVARMKIQREKSFASQLQIMKTLEREDGVLATFDYDGQPMMSSIIDDTIQQYHMRADFGPTHRKIRQLYAGGPVECIVQIPKTSKQKGNLRIIRPMQMPILPNPPYNHQPKPINLQDYKKHYGRKYTRLDHLSRTIEIPSSREGPEDLFAGQKQLRDFSTMVSSETARSRQTLRRMALPRLHGKYKVLDRYQAID